MVAYCETISPIIVAAVRIKVETQFRTFELVALQESTSCGYHVIVR